jgi:glycosyltransferase involved in cell wall biosynthesis
MRVLFVTHYTALLGANRSMLQLMKELRDKGVEVAALIPRGPGENDMANELSREGITHYVSWFRPTKGGRSVRGFVRYLTAPYGVFMALVALRGERFDVVHTNSSVIAVGKWIAIWKRAKHVWHLREFGDLDYGIRHPLGQRWQRVMYAGADAYIAISQSIAHHFAPYVSPAKLHVIYNGILPGQAPDSTHRSTVTNFVMVGLVVEGKRQHLAVEAAQQLVERGVSAFHLTIVGRMDSDYARSIRAYVEQHSLQSVVSFPGFSREVPKILAGQDVGLMLSSHEAFGRTTVEYMMQNLAVIATNGGANPEIITNNVDGVLLPDDSPRSIADAMQRLIANPADLQRLAAAGKQTALARFSSAANSAAILNLYTQLTE